MMSYSKTLLGTRHLLKFDVPIDTFRNKNIEKYWRLSTKSFTRKRLFAILSHSQIKSKLTGNTQQCNTFRLSFETSSSFNFSISHKKCNEKASTLEKINQDTPLTKVQVENLILRLTENERKTLLDALQEFNSNQIKAEYEGQLAATRWRSKFGRPSKLPTLGDVDPTGSYCHLPEDWLKKKYAEKVPAPTGHQLFRIGVFNAVPFVGFGFLDNFIMIVAGDYIDETLGSLVTISTMAAAALGNTISDVMGIGSAWYVELAASKVGLKPPNLSPIQLDMKSSRRAANLGRAIGIIVGCLLGMLPLLFINKEDVKIKKNPN